MSEYTKQALSFLQSNGVTLRITKAAYQSPAPWAQESNQISGYKHTVTMATSRGAYTFPFWDSLHNREIGKRPTTYDVLSCLMVWEGSLDDFVDEFGYSDTKTSLVIETYNQVIDQTLQLKHILPAKALNELTELN